MITRYDKETGKEELVSAKEFMDWVAPKTSCGRRVSALANLVDGGIYQTAKVAYYIKPIRSKVLEVRTNERKSNGLVKAGQRREIEEAEVCSLGTKKEGSTLSKELIQSAKEYIDENICSSTLSLEEVANHVYISKCYLSVLFRNQGVKYRDYVILKRIELAKKLLEQGISVTETCYGVGYGDTTHFARIFKRIVGVNPSMYQKKGDKCDQQHTA